MFKPEVLVFMIPIVAIVMGIGSGMLALYLNHKKRREMYVLYHQERMAALDKGVELPPLPDEFFAGEERGCRPSSPHGRLLTGLVLLFLGIAATVALYVEAPGHFLWGLVPMAIGLAFLLYYFTVGRREALLIEETIKAREAAKDAPPRS